MKTEKFDAKKFNQTTRVNAQKIETSKAIDRLIATNNSKRIR